MLSKKTSVVETQESYIEDKRYEKAKETSRGYKRILWELDRVLDRNTYIDVY